MRVAVLGAAGRMGIAVCQAVDSRPDLELVCAVDPGASGLRVADVAMLPDSTLVIAGTIDVLAQDLPDVVVDFTVASSAVSNMTWCANNGVHIVCGTTGISAGDIERLVELFAPTDRPNAVVAPNFAISAVLLMRFCELAAPYFDGVEVIELHHNEKRDAPSGTALDTAQRIASARERSGSGEFAPDPTTDERLSGARGGVGPLGIHLHSVRLPGLVAHEEVIFGGKGQALTIRQDSFDRTSFMPGVLLALGRVADTPGLTVGLDALLQF